MICQVCLNTFGLVVASIDCSEHTTVAEFGATAVNEVAGIDEVRNVHWKDTDSAHAFALYTGSSNRIRFPRWEKKAQRPCRKESESGN